MNPGPLTIQRARLPYVLHALFVNIITTIYNIINQVAECKKHAEFKLADGYKPRPYLLPGTVVLDNDLLPTDNIRSYKPVSFKDQI